jgi:hypothetical protein
MHRVLLNAPASLHVDHVNGNGLDNQRSNIRLATPGENQHNGRLRKNNSSGFKGVSWVTRDKRWQVSIWLGGKQRALGRFQNLEDAARAYDNAARELFGEFARLNFPEEGNTQ